MAEFDNPSRTRYEGDDITCKAASAIVGRRFVNVASDIDEAVGESVGATGDIIVEHCAAGARSFGVSKFDQPTVGGVVGAHAKRGRVVEVLAGAAISAGDEIAAGTAGKAVPVTDGGVKATLATGVVGNNNAITFTAREGGDEGNSITVTLVDPAGNNVALSVDVDEQDIIVTLATDGASAPTSTAADVIAAVNEHDAASQLVDVASTGASNGTGVCAAVAETALAGGVDQAAANGKAVGDAANDTVALVQLY